MISLPDQLSLEERREYFTNYDKFVEMFGQECVDEGLMHYRVGNLVELHELQHKQDSRGRSQGGILSSFRKPSRYLGQEKRMVYVPHPLDSSYTKMDYRVCDVYMVPSTYQGGHHNELIRPCLVKRFPWLEEFSLAIYTLNFYHHGGVEEFYVKVRDGKHGHNSLYVPYVAFLSGDAEAIRERNRSYLLSYDRVNGAEIAEEILNTDAAKKFLAYVEAG